MFAIITWHHRIQYELADLQYKNADPESAFQTLQAIGEHQDNGLTVKVLLLEADVSFDLGMYSECETICQSLLKKSLDKAVSKRALDLLGRVYEETDKHYAAALCFAGLLPDSMLGQELQPHTP